MSVSMNQLSLPWRSYPVSQRITSCLEKVSDMVAFGSCLSKWEKLLLIGLRWSVISVTHECFLATDFQEAEPHK